ncbi:phytoene desaturase family protein [Aquirufa regiilacus]|uniref:Phytoene desaturase family protein n=1 Tax=Aquirufa regiilacus TaxID=3024868 RepID=A0ABU3TNR6_9BACT|nr:phytoene desaturase family protein [Aquirufa sp. LEOWEIH-7C]MDU0807505.1 phytoene desaturase family protein [Aquirufa sp. LEOWEIH-7C]
MKKKKVIVIGAGFSGLSTATELADKGYEVMIVEKNEQAGGRARVFKEQGFTFDMGPSWYWMPDIFDNYFARFGKKTSDYYTLKRLDPSYSVILSDSEVVDMPADYDALRNLFESIEPGAANALDRFLEQAAYKYKVGIQEFVWKPSVKITEFLSLRILVDALRMDVFSSFYSHVRKFFKSDTLLKLMEFPILFLGAISQNTPAMYSLMNYAEIKLGTWYPMGGMHLIVKGMVDLALSKGVQIEYHAEVNGFAIEGGKVKGVKTSKGVFEADAVVASADYHHVETLLGEAHRNYDEAYWDKRVMAPSSLLFYLGINKRLPRLKHHNLFFDRDFSIHSHEIYTDPSWPSDPLFYASTPSVTDPSVAPDGCENLFLLIPVAPNLEDTEAVREQYFEQLMDRLELYCGVSIRDAIVYKRSYAHQDFIGDYHAFKGNAYGLANTLMQTAILKPSLKNRHLKNMFYTGQLTVPGPGVPPSLISGIVVAKEVDKLLK